MVLTDDIIAAYCSFYIAENELAQSWVMFLLVSISHVVILKKMPKNGDECVPRVFFIFIFLLIPSSAPKSRRILLKSIC